MIDYLSSQIYVLPPDELSGVYFLQIPNASK